MPISEHPKTGLIVTCDFNKGFKAPEMVKRRPVIIMSAKSPGRAGLCTVVALSTTDPNPIMPFHARIILEEELALPSGKKEMWIKGDMINVVSFNRLDFIKVGRDEDGSRNYQYIYLTKEQLKLARACVLRSLGMFSLTKHL